MLRLLTTFLLLCSLSVLQAQETGLVVYAEQENGSVFLYADNAQVYPQSVKVTLDLKGLKPREEVDPWYVVSNNSEKQLLVELVIPQNRSWSYKFNYVYFKGDIINTEHNGAYVYRLPYEEGKTVRIVQGYNGKESHSGQNALDFDLREGEPILAAREGLVAQVKEDSNRGCPDRSCATLGNYVSILHDDGTFADYYHLQQNGALVEPGDRVKAGQVIGKTGNTGWASGPHLHFIVYKRLAEGRETFRTRFRTSESLSEYLQESARYTAVN